MHFAFDTNYSSPSATSWEGPRRLPGAMGLGGEEGERGMKEAHPYPSICSKVEILDEGEGTPKMLHAGNAIWSWAGSV